MSRLIELLHGDGFGVAEAHVVEEHAEIRLIDAELRLHGACRQADLASDHAAAAGQPAFGIHSLDGIGIRGIQAGMARSQGLRVAARPGSVPQGCGCFSQDGWLGRHGFSVARARQAD
jgi:hypothetical protein